MTGWIAVALLRGASSFDSLTSEEDESTPLRVCVTDERAGWFAMVFFAALANLSVSIL